VKVIKDLPEDCSADVVIFCDDICDSGNTLFTLVERAQLRGIQAVTAVLLDRQRSDRMVAPTLAALQDSRAGWWFGFGMDDPEGGGRNNLNLCVIS
jgi:hypoxanthine-guanine phosphoribosyltransferase